MLPRRIAVFPRLKRLDVVIYREGKVVAVISINNLCEPIRLSLCEFGVIGIAIEVDSVGNLILPHLLQVLSKLLIKVADTVSCSKNHRINIGVLHRLPIDRALPRRHVKNLKGGRGKQFTGTIVKRLHATRCLPIRSVRILGNPRLRGVPHVLWIRYIGLMLLAISKVLLE